MTLQLEQLKGASLRNLKKEKSVSPIDSLHAFSKFLISVCIQFPTKKERGKKTQPKFIERFEVSVDTS